MLNDFLEYLISLILPHINECNICLEFLLFICPEVLYEGLNFEINKKKTEEILKKIGIEDYEKPKKSFVEMVWGEETAEIDCDEFKRGIDRVLRLTIGGKEIGFEEG